MLESVMAYENVSRFSLYYDQQRSRGIILLQDGTTNFRET